MMIVQLLNHFRLTGRLLKDARVNIWLKVALIALPAIYAAIPLAIEIPDFIPVVGLIDDLALIGMSTLIFNTVSPSAVVQEHALALQGISGDSSVNLEVCRHPDELRNLGVGLLVSLDVLLVTGMAVGFVWLLLFGLGYIVTGLGRAQLLANAIECTPTQLPELHKALLAGQAGLRPVKVNLFVTQNPVLNAYTFGYREPYTIVLTSGLVEKLTPEEIQAVIGHELGHIHFNHVVLINLMGMSVTGIERLIFYLWSRSCEYSADAIALQASGNDPKPMISALLKLASGLQNVSVDLDVFLAQVQEGDEKKVSERAEMLSTHPFIHNRIRRLIEMSSRSGYTSVELQPQPSL
jgi:Zn-dependent protease with chaperone function